MAGIGVGTVDEATGGGANVRDRWEEEGKDLFERLAKLDLSGQTEAQKKAVETDQLKALEAYDKELMKSVAIHAQEIEDLEHLMVKKLFEEMVKVGVENVPDLEGSSYYLHRQLADSLNAMVVPAHVLVKGMDPVPLFKRADDILDSHQLELVIAEKHKVAAERRCLKHTFDLAFNRAKVLRSMMKINWKLFLMVSDTDDKKNADALLGYHHSLEQDFLYLVKFMEQLKPALGDSINTSTHTASDTCTASSSPSSSTSTIKENGTA